MKRLYVKAWGATTRPMKTTNNRPRGWYFVKTAGADQLGLWEGGHWSIIGIEKPLKDKDMEWIGPPVIMKAWIDVADMLPKPLTFVLATIETDHETWVEIVGFDGRKFQLPGREKATPRVTAWMYVLEPYKKPA